MYKKKIKILIFIITYQASYRVKKVFEDIPFDRLKNFNIKVLLSDDNSKDDTLEYINKLNHKYKNIIINKNYINLGYGAHIKKSLNFAINKKFDYAIMIHGDGQYSPKYIPLMIKNFINNVNDKSHLIAVTGSRLYRGIKNVKNGGMPLYKMIGNLFLTYLYNLLFHTNFTDAHTGLWAYNLNLLKALKFNKLTDTFNFDQEFRFYSNFKNLEIKEIFIKTKYGDERSQLHIVYALRFFLNSFKFFLIKKKILKNKRFL